MRKAASLLTDGDVFSTRGIEEGTAYGDPIHLDGNVLIAMEDGSTISLDGGTTVQVRTDS